MALEFWRCCFTALPFAPVAAPTNSVIGFGFAGPLSYYSIDLVYSFVDRAASNVRLSVLRT